MATTAADESPELDLVETEVEPVDAPSAGAGWRGWRHWLGDDRLEDVVALACLGGLLEICLVVLVQRFPLGKWYPAPGVSLGFPQMMTGSPNADATWYAFVTGAPFLAFVPALFYVRHAHSRLAHAVVIAFAVLFGVTLLPLYPIAAADIFHYVADARTLVVYHQNPMIVAPIAHPFFVSISWMEQASPYGPFWQALTIVPILLAGNSAVGSVIALKLLAFAFFLLCGVLVYAIVRRTFPGRELIATLAFLWNPFLTFRAVGNGHNDIVMMALALLALYCVLARRWLFVFPVLALSICTKYATVLMVPPIFMYGWQIDGGRYRREMITGGLVATVLTVLIFVPFWAGADTFQTFVGQNNHAISSPPQLFTLVLTDFGVLTASPATDHLMRQFGTVAFGLVYLGMLAVLYRRPGFNVLVALMALMFVLYLVLQQWWFRPWYFLWFLPLVALLPTRFWIAVAVAATFGATFFDMIEQYRGYWPWVWNDNLRSYAAPVVAAFGPLLLCLAFGVVVLVARRYGRRVGRFRFFQPARAN